MHILETIIADIWFWLKAMAQQKSITYHSGSIPAPLPCIKTYKRKIERQRERERMLLKFTSRARKLCRALSHSSVPFCMHTVHVLCICVMRCTLAMLLFTARYCYSLFKILVVPCLKTHQITFSNTQRREYNKKIFFSVRFVSLNPIRYLRLSAAAIAFVVIFVVAIFFCYLYFGTVRLSYIYKCECMCVCVFDGRCEFQNKITQHIHEQTKRACRQRRTMQLCIWVWPLYVHLNIRYISNGIDIILLPFASHHLFSVRSYTWLHAWALNDSLLVYVSLLSLSISLPLFVSHCSVHFEPDRRHQ